MRLNIYIRCLLLCSFVFSFNVFSKNDLLEKTNEFITDYTEFTSQLITDLNCNEYQSIFDKSQWIRYKEFIFGKPQEVCCVINNTEVFSSLSKDYKSLRDQSLYLQYELSSRISFKDDCGFTTLMSASRSLKDDIVDLRKCKNNSKCNISNLSKKIRSCRFSIDMFNKLISEKNRIPNTQSCLQTHLVKPVVEGANTTKEPPLTLSPNFNQLFFSNLNALKDTINKGITQTELGGISKLIQQLKDSLVLLWTVQISTPLSINFKNAEETTPICDTSGLSYTLASIDKITKKLMQCFRDNTCNNKSVNDKIGELILARNILIEQFAENQIFKDCMTESLNQSETGVYHLK